MKNGKEKGEILAQLCGGGDHGGWIAYRAVELEDGDYDFGPSYMGGTEQEAIDNLLADEALEAYKSRVFMMRSIMGDEAYEMMKEGQ